LNESIKVVLCLRSDSAALCQIVDQKGWGYILSSQVVHGRKGFEHSEIVLRDLLKKFDEKLLRRVTAILFPSNIFSHFLLEVFVLQDKHFRQAALFELDHRLGDRLHQFEFNLHKPSKGHFACASLMLKSQLARCIQTFKDFSIKNPKILLASSMFVEEAKHQITTRPTVFLEVNRDVLNMVLCRQKECYSYFLSIDLRKLATLIGTVSQYTPSTNEVFNLIGATEAQGNDPQKQKCIHTFFDRLCLKIMKIVKRHFPNTSVTFIDGGNEASHYAIGQRLAKVGQVMSYHAFFRSQISPAIASEAILTIEPFIPALLASVIPHKKSFNEDVNFPMGTSNLDREKQTYTFLGKLTAGLFCITSLLFFCTQKLNDQRIQAEKEHRQLSRRYAELSQIAKRIESVNEHIQEQKKLLNQVLIYVEQHRAWCSLFNNLQGILARAGNAYLDSFLWSTREDPKTKTSPPPASTKKFPGPQKPKTPAEGKQEQENPIPEISSTIDISGVMFIGDVEISEEIQQTFNRKFNRLFNDIRQLPDCAEVNDIKVNAPENCKMTFRCTIKLSPTSRILAV
jgi:hypothetical protein